MTLSPDRDAAYVAARERLAALGDSRPVTVVEMADAALDEACRIEAGLAAFGDDAERRRRALVFRRINLLIGAQARGGAR